MFPREDTLQPIARIVKSYGTEGEVMVSFPDRMSDILKTDEPVWLFYDGLPVPFFIQTIQFKGPRKAIVRLEDIDTLAPPQEKRHILLPTVHVDERWAYENPRVAWETEAVGRQKAFLYYDCDAAVDLISDKGKEIPTFEDWLKERNEYFTGQTYVVHDETPEEDLEEEIKLMNPEYSPDNGGDEKRFNLLLEQMKIGSTVIDKEYNIYKDGLMYDNRPIVWVIDNSYHSLTGTNYNFPPNPNTTPSHIDPDLSPRPMMQVIFTNSTTHNTVEMPIFLDEVKSVYVADDQSTWRKFIRFKNENIQMPVTVFVYTHHSFFGNVIGLLRTYFHFYKVHSTF